MKSEDIRKVVKILEANKEPDYICIGCHEIYYIFGEFESGEHFCDKCGYEIVREKGDK